MLLPRSIRRPHVPELPAAAEEFAPDAVPPDVIGDRGGSPANIAGAPPGSPITGRNAG